MQTKLFDNNICKHGYYEGNYPMVPSAKAIASHRPEEHMKEDIHNNKGNIENSVESFLLAALLECAGRDDFNFLNNSIIMKNAILYATNDLIAYMQKDPAAKSNATLLLSTSTSYTAVLHYRLANFIEKHIESNHQPFVDPLLPAKISRRGKILSGAEIHHKSRIGKRFVLDHGYGTVIGETSAIGEDCYFLGGITLGARGVSGNPDLPRHPVIGNRVQIGAHTSIFGRIEIGNDVFIGPNCVITQGIPSNSIVRLRSSIQITSSK